MLERYLADLRGDRIHAQRRGTHIGLLNRFFSAIRQHRWDTALPARRDVLHRGLPETRERLPRALAEHVMAQLEHPDNLARFADPAHRLITIILMRCGLRVTDALRLRNDCLVADAEGAPYLRYLNHKMKRDALVPIDDQLRELIAEHRTRTAAALAGRHTRTVPAARRRTSTAPTRSPAPPTGWHCCAGWPPATSATSTASRCT